MGKLINIKGKKYGNLTVISFDHIGECRKSFWLCKCDCGNEIIVTSNHLRKGNTKSCGCITRELTKNINLSHGLSYEPLYKTYTTMKSRCYNKNTKAYKDYGGRGIKMCEEWKTDFGKFYNYMTQLPKFGEEGHTIDRIDNDGNYEPSNVRYATAKQQANNTRKQKK